MKKRVLLISVVMVFAFSVFSAGQEAQKSSGVVKLNMKKKEEPVRTGTQEQTPAEIQRGSGVVNLNMKKVEPQPQVTNTKVSLPMGGTGGINWISPAFNQINTSEGSYKIQANVQSDEQIRVVNFFVNGEFFTNVIPAGQMKNQVFIEETLDLNLGNNGIRIEAITYSNKKLESSVNINYNLSNAKFHALIIAVQDYDDPGINDLDEPIRDANRFYKVITANYTFSEENILYLKNPTKADIIGTLHQMRSILKPEDNLLIYYAGHGYWDEEMMTGYWLPRDANRDNPVNWLPNTDLTNYLNVLKTKHTLLIADACFSGGIFKTRSAFSTSAAIEKLYKLPSRKAITSGTLTEVPDKSVFVEYLIKRLEENSENYLSSEQLFSSLRVAVMNNSPNVPQYGTIQNVGDEGGDFIFIRR